MTRETLSKLARLHRELAEVYEGAALHDGTASRLLPSEARLMGLRKSILSLIEDRPGITSVQITDALWPSHKHMEKADLKRRVIVMVSSMYKKDKLVEKKGDGKEAQWHLTKRKG